MTIRKIVLTYEHPNKALGRRFAHSGDHITDVDWEKGKYVKQMIEGDWVIVSDNRNKLGEESFVFVGFKSKQEAVAIAQLLFVGKSFCFAKGEKG